MKARTLCFASVLVLQSLAMTPGNRPALRAQQATATGTITGTVTDAGTGYGIPGAAVAVEGSAVRATVDRDGRFTKRLYKAEERLIFVPCRSPLSPRRRARW